MKPREEDDVVAGKGFEMVIGQALVAAYIGQMPIFR